MVVQILRKCSGSAGSQVKSPYKTLYLLKYPSFQHRDTFGCFNVSNEMLILPLNRYQKKFSFNKVKGSLDKGGIILYRIQWDTSNSPHCNNMSKSSQTV